MSPSEQCKAAGLKSLAELSRISGVSEQTLINWHRDKPVLFRLVIAGAMAGDYPELRDQVSLYFTARDRFLAAPMLDKDSEQLSKTMLQHEQLLRDMIKRR